MTEVLRQIGAMFAKELLVEFGEIEHEKSGHKSFFEKIANYFS